jgi:hypothetical protein
MKMRAVAVLGSLAVSLLMVPVHAGQTNDGPRFHVRIESKDAPALYARLDAAGFDVVRADDSSIELVVSRDERRALESRGYTVVDRARCRTRCSLRPPRRQRSWRERRWRRPLWHRRRTWTSMAW